MRTCKSILVATLALAAVMVGADETQSIEILCHRTETSPVIDGDLSDPAWRRATPITPFHQLYSNGPAQFQSVAFMLYDDTHLYIGVLMRKEHDAGLSDGLWQDNIEIFLDPERTGSRYYQLAANHKSQFAARPVRDATWSPAMKAAGRALPYGWSLEIALPLAELEETTLPKAGTLWRGNICRTDPRHGYSTVARLRGGSGFHAPGAFLTIRFTDEPAGAEGAEALRTMGRDAQAVEEAFAARAADRMRMIGTVTDEMVAASLRAQLDRHIERAGEVRGADVRDEGPFGALGRYWLLSSLLADMTENLDWEIKTAALFE